MKNKAKEFWEKNKGEVTRIVYFGLGFGFGYFASRTITELRIENGLQQCIKVKPELDGALKEAIKIVSSKKE